MIPDALAGKFVRAESGCWNWIRSKNPAGYGQVRINWKLLSAHRVMWEHQNGPIPEGMIILHACDNPACVNPLHLILGTHAHNVEDKEAKGRGNGARLFGKRNHKLSLQDVREIRDLNRYGYSQAELGRIYGVNRSCIFKNINGHLGGKA